MKNLILRWIAAYWSGFLLFMILGAFYCTSPNHHYTLLQCVAVSEVVWCILFGIAVSLALAIRLGVYALDGE